MVGRGTDQHRAPSPAADESGRERGARGVVGEGAWFRLPGVAPVPAPSRGGDGDPPDVGGIRAEANERPVALHYALPCLP